MLPIDTCLVSNKFYKSPLTNYDFGVAIGALLLKLQNFKKVKLIFGHPVWPYASLNHNEICRIPYENASRTGIRLLPNI